MRSKQWWTRVAAAPVIVAAVLGAAGCEEPAMKTARKAPPAEAAPPAPIPSVADAQPAGATQPQTVPSDTQPANAFLTIDGKVMEFPPARLRLTKTDEGASALLYSDDPPESSRAGYTGNGFFFELPLQTNEPGNIDGAEYHYRANDSEPSERPNGILLQGTRYKLQPQDVAMKFDADGAKVMVRIAGRFLVVRTTEESVPGQMAAVQGTLYTTAEVKEAR
jgi:hypothetical protein